MFLNDWTHYEYGIIKNPFREIILFQIHVRVGWLIFKQKVKYSNFEIWGNKVSSLIVVLKKLQKKKKKEKTNTWNDKFNLGQKHHSLKN